MAQSQKLLSLTEMDAAVKQKVTEVYRCLAPDFRERMDSKIIGIDWNVIDFRKVRDKFGRMVQEVYGTGQPADAKILQAIKFSDEKNTREFLRCVRAEVDLNSATRKRRRTTDSSASSMTSVMGKSQVYLNASEMMRVPNYLFPNSQKTASAVTNFAAIELPPINYFKTLDDDFLVLKNYERLTNSNAVSNEIILQALTEWKGAANRLLMTERNILQSVNEALCQWDTHKRRLANLFDHNDERFNSDSKKFDQNLFVQIDAVYTQEINTIERDAQAAVKRLYDLSDSGECLLARFSMLDGEIRPFIHAARNLITEFAVNTFVVWRQSDQVVKAGNKFKATLRLLVGPVLRLNEQISVNVIMLTSEQIKRGLITKEFPRMSPTGIDVTSEPSSVPFESVSRSNEYDPTIMRTGPAGRKNRGGHQRGDPDEQSMVAEFSSVTWKNKDKRSAKKENELTVCEMKYAAVFQATVNLHGELLKICCWSQPLILIVHASQECKAHGTVFWDNSFSPPRREPFFVPDEVSWDVFYNQFVNWFCVITRAPGYQLAEHNTEFIFNCLAEQKMDLSGFKVTLCRFYRERPENSPIKFNFWDWIYGICKIIREEKFAQFLWSQGAVYGFANHHTASMKLRNNESPNCNSTMLLRFSTTPVVRKGVPAERSERLVGLVIMITSVSSRTGFMVSSLSPATLDDLNGVANLRTRMLAPQIVKKEIYGGIAWQEELLPQFDKTTNFDDTDVPDISDHYTRVEIGVMLPENFMDEVQSTSFPILTGEKLEDMDDNESIRLLLAGFSGINTCSNEPNLSGIEPFNGTEANGNDLKLLEKLRRT